MLSTKKCEIQNWIHQILLKINLRFVKVVEKKYNGMSEIVSEKIIDNDHVKSDVSKLVLQSPVKLDLLRWKY